MEGFCLPIGELMSYRVQTAEVDDSGDACGAPAASTFHGQCGKAGEKLVLLSMEEQPGPQARASL